MRPLSSAPSVLRYAITSLICAASSLNSGMEGCPVRYLGQGLGKVLNGVAGVQRPERAGYGERTLLLFVRLHGSRTIRLNERLPR